MPCGCRCSRGCHLPGETATSEGPALPECRDGLARARPKPHNCWGHPSSRYSSTRRGWLAYLDYRWAHLPSRRRILPPALRHVPGARAGPRSRSGSCVITPAKRTSTRWSATLNDEPGGSHIRLQQRLTRPPRRPARPRGWQESTVPGAAPGRTANAGGTASSALRRERRSGGTAARGRLRLAHGRATRAAWGASSQAPGARSNSRPIRSRSGAARAGPAWAAREAAPLLVSGVWPSIPEATRGASRSSRGSAEWPVDRRGARRAGGVAPRSGRSSALGQYLLSLLPGRGYCVACCDARHWPPSSRGTTPPAARRAALRARPPPHARRPLRGGRAAFSSCIPPPTATTFRQHSAITSLPQPAPATPKTHFPAASVATWGPTPGARGRRPAPPRPEERDTPSPEWLLRDIQLSRTSQLAGRVDRARGDEERARGRCTFCELLLQASCSSTTQAALRTACSPR